MFIMVATGTGIAPYRAFWRRQFMEDVPNYKCGRASPPHAHFSRSTKQHHQQDAMASRMFGVTTGRQHGAARWRPDA